MQILHLYVALLVFIDTASRAKILFLYYSKILAHFFIEGGQIILLHSISRQLTLIEWEIKIWGPTISSENHLMLTSIAVPVDGWLYQDFLHLLLHFGWLRREELDIPRQYDDRHHRRKRPSASSLLKSISRATNQSRHHRVPVGLVPLLAIISLFSRDRLYDKYFAPFC